MEQRAEGGRADRDVGKRFLLSVEGRQIDEIKVLHDVVAKIDLAKLASLQ